MYRCVGGVRGDARQVLRWRGKCVEEGRKMEGKGKGITEGGREREKNGRKFKERGRERERGNNYIVN